MPKPSRLVIVVVALVIIIGLTIVIFVRPQNTVASPRVTTTTVPCQSAQLTSDYQIDNCLEASIRTMNTKMNMSLRKESRYLRYGSPAQDWRVVRRTQSTFIAFSRSECLSQANPYQPGTIVPILYGECVLQLYHQRLDDIKRVLEFFRHGGESRPAS